MSNNILALAIIEALSAVRRLGDAPIEDRLKCAMGCTHSFWLSTDDNLRFKGAVGAVMESYGQGNPEWEQLSEELGTIGRANAILSACMSGVPIDWNRMNENEVLPIPKLGLIKMWREAKGEKP